MAAKGLIRNFDEGVLHKDRAQHLVLKKTIKTRIFLFLFLLLLYPFLFCFVLFCFVLFCFVLFCFVLFCFVLDKITFTWSQDIIDISTKYGVASKFTSFVAIEERKEGETTKKNPKISDLLAEHPLDNLPYIHVFISPALLFDKTINIGYTTKTYPTTSSFKVVLCGDRAVGKTAWLKRQVSSFHYSCKSAFNYLFCSSLENSRRSISVSYFFFLNIFLIRFSLTWTRVFGSLHLLYQPRDHQIHVLGGFW